jgi:hypothetical protein
LQHRKGISYHYASLFETKGSDEAKGISSKWGWYAIIHELAQGNVLSIKPVTEMYIEEVLTFMAYEKDVAVSQKVNIDANNSRHK